MIKSIRTRLVITMVLITAVLLALTLIYSVTNQLNYLKRNLIDQSLLDLDVLAEYCSVPLAFDQPDDANVILSKMDKLPHLFFIAVYDLEEQLFATYKADSLQTIPDKTPAFERILFTQKAMWIKAPIVYNSISYGVLVAEIDLNFWKREKKELIGTFIGVFILLVALSIIVSLVFERVFTRPLLLLSGKMKQVSEANDFRSYIEDERDDEIGVLFRGYNYMISQLEKWKNKQLETEGKLREANEQLEKKVVERTNDLEESHQRVQRLLENEQTILRNLPYGIILVNENRKIIEMNDHARDILGYSNGTPEYITDICTLGACVDGYDKCPYWSLDSRELKSIQSEFLHESGDRVPVLKTVIPIHYSGENVLMEAFVDITDLQRIQQELISAKEKAEESDRLKSSFLANVSHEIRTPLNAIVGFSGLLGSTDLDEPEKKEFHDIVASNSDALINLIDDILDLSKLESGSLNLNYKYFNLEKFLKDINENALMLLSRMDKKHLNINIVSEGISVGHEIRFDQLRLKQILFNLISNSIKFTDKGTITIGVEKQTDKYIFYVEDTGIGISVKDQKRIFERFFKVTPKMSKLFNGTGLGLSICKYLVDLWDGRIWVESQEGVGTKIAFTIPV